MTDEATEMPRSCSTAIQSEVANLPLFRALTVPAIWMAPPNSNSFSVSVVLPASGCEMMAKVRRFLTSRTKAGSPVWAGAVAVDSIGGGEAGKHGILPEQTD